MRARYPVRYTLLSPRLSACSVALTAACLGLGACDSSVFQTQDASVEVRISGTPDDPGIMVTAFVQDRSAPFNRIENQVALGSSTLFENLGADFTIVVGVANLSTHKCTVVRTNNPLNPTADSIDVTTRARSTNVVEFELICKSATLDLEVLGLPAGQDARVFVRSPVDSVDLRTGNGTRRVNVVPSPQWEIRPNIVVDAGITPARTYRAPGQQLSIPSRQISHATVHYTGTACAYSQPTAWYRFNSGAATDASGNGNGGIVLGGTAATDRHGSNDAALSFDGSDDSIELGDRFNSLAIPFSIAAWVRQPASARTEFRSIFISDDEPNHYLGIWFQTEPGGLPQITFAAGGPVGPASRRTLVANTPIPADTWVHITATVRGPTDMTLYVNGAEVPGTYSGTGGPLVHGPAPARIGNITTTPLNRPWLGLLDEIRIYACSLDASEVAALFAQD
jgi:hypothetical protein